MVVSLIWLGAVMIAYSLMAAMLWALLWWFRRSGAGRRSPLARNLLREPGDSLRTELEDIDADLVGIFCLLLMAPLIVYSSWITQVHFSAAGDSPAGLAGLAGASIVIVGIALVWLLRVLARRRSLRLGLDGELAVGQELNQLMQKGYAVFHDVPGERFNIDHVVVSQAGVFAVETKARPKAITHDSKADAEVVYDGRTLRFPTWESAEYLEQAVRQAAWLSRWLTSAVGEPVGASPVLALPGWYIKRVQRGSVEVINGRDANYLARSGDVRLSASLIQRIVHQLDARCRTVEPRAYRRVGS